MDFRIRHADPTDAEQLTRLADAVSAEPQGWLISVAGEWRSAGDERRFLKALRRYPHAAVFVAEREDGSLVGRLSIGRLRAGQSSPRSPRRRDSALPCRGPSPEPGCCRTW